MSEPATDVSTDRDPLLLDVMCGSLVTYLRMCGYDAAYALDRGIEADDALLALAAREDRRLLTRDEQLAERAGDRGLLLRSRDLDDQLRELRDAGFALSPTVERCSQCNGILDRVSTDAATPADAPDPGDTAVWECRDCGQHFWRGSHWDDVRRRLAEL